MHRSGKLCFSRYQANKFHCKSISWFKLRAYSNIAKNFLCGTDAALIAAVLIWPLFSIRAKLQIQNLLLVHLTLTAYQCVRSSIGIIDVFKQNTICTVWHLSSPLLKGQGRQGKKTRIGWCRIM